MVRFHGTRGMKMMFAFVLVLVMASMAFGDATGQLLNAAESGKITTTTIRRLVEAGADVNAKDEDGMTALMWLARSENDDMNIKTRIDAVNALVKYGTDVNTRDNNGQTL